MLKVLLCLEPCRVISSVASGRQVSIDTAHVRQGVDVEFIWTIKLPDNIPPHDSDTSVFLRLSNSTLDGTSTDNFTCVGCMMFKFHLSLLL
jgi:hypothetical protein